MNYKIKMTIGLPLVAIVIAACGGGPPFNPNLIRTDCKKGQSVKELIQRGDTHRNKMVREDPPPNMDANQWMERRKTYGSRARTCYRLALESKPDHVYALINNGFISIVESSFQKTNEDQRDRVLVTATNYIEKALNVQTLDAQAYYYLGEIAARRGQCDKAMRIFNSLLTSRWKYSHVYTWMGYCQESEGKKKEAQEAYQKAVDESNPVAIAEWARLRMK